MIIYSFRFFPAAGRRGIDGLVANRNYIGYYWSFSTSSPACAWLAYFYGDQVNPEIFARTLGYSVRCVAREVSNYNCFWLFLLLDI